MSESGNFTNWLIDLNDKYEEMKSENEALIKDLDCIMSVTDIYNGKIERLHVSMIQLERQKESLDYELEDEVDTTQSIGEEDKIEMRESALRTQIERLEKRIQRESYREVMERCVYHRLKRI